METPSGGPGPEESFLPSMVITTPIKDAHFSKEMLPVPPVPPIPSILPRAPSPPIFPRGGHVSPVRTQADITKE
ncbi:MAG TPA: hypothetical protein VGO47_07525, partial [Chlamydiales bacterium]|nr:hypothetical protein [Chlamydiales bacterium]